MTTHLLAHDTEHAVPLHVTRHLGVKLGDVCRVGGATNLNHFRTQAVDMGLDCDDPGVGSLVNEVDIGR